MTLTSVENSTKVIVFSYRQMITSVFSLLRINHLGVISNLPHAARSGVAVRTPALSAHNAAWVRF